MIKTPSFRLDGKRALVIGASSGIGQGCAVALGEYGAKVFAMARRKEALAQTRSMIGAVGGVATSVPLDVTDVALCEGWIAENGPFDILVNSAGTARHGPALDTNENDFDAVMELNVKSAFFITQAVARGLIKAGLRGSLINISSQMAKIGGRNRAVYGASKHALEGMTKSMAVEWGSYGIRVNTICPTFIRTSLTAPTFNDPKQVKWIEEKIKIDRVGEVEDVMGATVFLAGEASAMITGAALMIDGGWTAG